MQRAFSCSALVAFGLCFSLTLAASIPVPPGGTLNTFDTFPTPDSWSTRFNAGANNAITTPAQLDAAVQASDLTGFVSLYLTNTLPPTIFALAAWNGAAGNIQMRPTGSSYLSLLATLQNNTGASASSVNISYDFGSAYTENVNETIPGLRAYYSLTGLAGSYQLIHEFTTATPGTLSATLNLGDWANGSPLYLLWADDNGPGSAGGEAGATLEGAYTIDNFLVVPVPEPSVVALAVTALLAGIACYRRGASRA